jgi:hypothetical protein
VKWLRFLLISLTFSSLGLFLLSFVPTQRVLLESDLIPLPDLGYGLTVDIDYPTQLRLGAADPLRLTTRLETATGSAQTISPNTLLVLHPDSDCIRTEPPGDTAQAITPNDDQLWFWELEPTDTGACDLTLVALLQSPDTQDEAVIYIQKLEIENSSLFGFAPHVLRVVGIVGGIVGLIACAIIQLRLNKISIVENREKQK